MYRSMIVACVGLAMLVGALVTGIAAEQAKRGQKQQAARGNKPNQAAANANGNAVNPVQMLLQQFDRNGNGVLDGEELVQVAAVFQQLMMARSAENGAVMGGVQGGGGRGFGAKGQGFGAAGQGFGQGGGNQQGAQYRFQHGQGGQGGAGAGVGRGGGGNGNGSR